MSQPYQSPSTHNLLSPSGPGGAPSIRTVASNASLRSQSDSRYAIASEGSSSPVPASISDKFAMSPDPSSWGGDLSPSFREPDDELHNPDPKRDRKSDKGGTIFTSRGIANLGCLFILFGGMGMLFAGYPLISHFTKKEQATLGGFNLGGTNATGQVPKMPGNWGLVDLDTPKEVYSKVDYVNGKTWELVWSDEFNTDGRTFYPGDDPYWEAVDLHYWQTNNMEWYDPAAITTRNGSLEITLSQKETHGLDYQGGMMTTWNKFCFTGGLIETSVVLPGANNIVGLWPAIWTMGNLGRAGYGASLEGMWPYTYDSCDVGTVANQTLNGLPIAATENGDPTEGGVLSFLPGQRLSRCTCQGESHPGPVHSDGTYVGRAAPEIDIFEATMGGDPLQGQVSQSGQWAPFNAEYSWFNTSANLIIPNTTLTQYNTYVGGAFQQTSSGLTFTNQEAYERTGNQYSVYGVQYQPGFDGAYIAWIADGRRAWQINQAGMAADPRVEIGARAVPQEPMYLIANLGMSRNFGFVDLDHIIFPTTMKVDYIRVYQDPDMKNVGCDPDDFPTAAYINEYLEAYTNPNLTTWRNDFGQPFPKSTFLGQC
ncbi:glycoside hydrolase family 16 protein [Phanerochaete sordida]|uniref:Glycoside hydrolase family 16 protein n=1 Tax=Phanerochaete sordida TaxID=48140 RepID=A0A9P3G3L3_9APHY|nr:glycoside hydrolase family 16 protein [Phanerochaete sordida]